MAKPSSLLLIFSVLFVFLHVCSSSNLLGQQEQYWQNLRGQQQHRLRARTDCRVERLTAQEPTNRFKSEAGWTEFWDRNNEQFECAGVAAVRNVIQPKGLLLPHYNNAPQLIYIVQGRGLQGTVIPGCAETYESESRQGRSEHGGRRSVDRHQKIRQFRQGDILALPAGVTLWFYNSGEEQLVTVALLDTGNPVNQLDQTFRNFFLAGNPYSGRQSYYSKREQGEEEQRSKRNIFYGFEEEILSEVFNVDRETARKLKGQDDERGQIIRAENWDVAFPYDEQEEGQQEGGRWEANGFEETACTAKLRINLDHPSGADVYNPRGGRIASLNSQKLPILSWLRLSAEKGVLYKNAVMAPHWTVNAHSMIYVTRGSGRFQVVGHTGKSVFDGEVRQGQMIIVPQNFVVMKRASEDEGLEWISFKTNDNAMTSQLAGRLSAIRAMPEEVLMNSYQISRQDARNLKYRRDESRVFSPSRSSSWSPRPKPLGYALDVIKSMM